MEARVAAVVCLMIYYIGRGQKDGPENNKLNSNLFGEIWRDLIYFMEVFGKTPSERVEETQSVYCTILSF